MLRLTLDALEVLDAIARRGSFAAAAQELHRTTSTLSYTVKKLEDDLGVCAFDRSGHRAVLTEAGRLLLEEGRAVLDAARAMERRLRTIGAGWEAELTIAVNDVVPIEPVLRVVGEFCAAGHPTRIRLLSEVLGGVWESLLAQRADVALTEIESADAPEIMHRSLGNVAFVFAVAPGHALAGAAQPVPVAEIRRHRVVVVADSARGAPPRSSGIASGADVLTVPSLRAKLAAQRAGLGVGFLPEALAAGAIARGELIPLRVATPKPQIALSVAWRATGAGPATQWFVQRLAELDLTATA
jgi:DNA-binding transcriptional LysR family regulator